MLYQDGKRCLAGIFEQGEEYFCTFGADSGKQPWYLVGDSTAGSLGCALYKYLKDHNSSLTVLTKGACPYVPGVIIQVNGKTTCSKSYNLTSRKMLLDASPSTVVIHNLLHIYIHGSQNRPHLESKIYRIKSDMGPTSQAIEVEDIRHRVHQAIEELLEHGHRVVIVYPIHTADFDVKKRAKQFEQMPSQKRRNWLTSELSSISYLEFREFADVAYQIYDSLRDRRGLIRVLPENLFCDPSSSGHCKIFSHNVSFYHDFTHLSYYGTCKLVQAIFEALPSANKESHKDHCQPTYK